MKTYNKELFQKIGLVLFAIAISDKKIHPDEYNIVKQVVKEQWVHMYQNTIECNTNAIDQIKNVFDWLVKNPRTSENLLKEFEVFKNENYTMFTPELKSSISKAASAVANSYANKNKSELIALAKLHLILKK